MATKKLKVMIFALILLDCWMKTAIFVNNH